MADTSDIICIGAMLWDVIGRAVPQLARGDDIPGRIIRQPGGVALNVATALARLNACPTVLSALGQDEAGDALILASARLGIRTEHLYRSAVTTTDQYLAIEDQGGLLAAIADARALETAGDLVLAPLADGRLASAEHPWPGHVILDGNLPPATLTRAAALPGLAKARIRLVAASPEKAGRLRALLRRPNTILHLNRLEAQEIAGNVFPDAAHAAAGLIALGAHRVIITDSARPVADAMVGQPAIIMAPPAVSVRHVTGAGDCFLAAHLLAEIRGADRKAALDAALVAAAAHISGKDHPA